MSPILLRRPAIKVDLVRLGVRRRLARHCSRATGAVPGNVSLFMTLEASSLGLVLAVVDLHRFSLTSPGPATHGGRGLTQGAFLFLGLFLPLLFSLRVLAPKLFGEVLSLLVPVPELLELDEFRLPLCIVHRESSCLIDLVDQWCVHVLLEETDQVPLLPFSIACPVCYLFKMEEKVFQGVFVFSEHLKL
jgi:hypothetical protein